MFADVKGPSFIFWPVGCGDSTTVVVSDTEVMQIDLNDTLIAAADDNERIPLVDELVAKLPIRDGKPYLSCFVLTHPDLDHCRGFADLLKRVLIGELWHTPRVFREYHKDFSEDAKAFRKEAKRRVAATIKAGGKDPGPGNRVRVVGYDDLLQEEAYKGFPLSAFTTPGQSVVVVDGADVSDRFHAFAHAPFKTDAAEARNETSLALRILIGSSHKTMAGLFLGDLSYPTLRRVFDETHAHGNDGMIEWDVLLAPHHCSKKAMYEKNADGQDVLKQDILDDLVAAQRIGGRIIASSGPIPGSNTSGDNPPHAKARNRYLEIANGEFVCTAEHSTVDDMRPLILSVEGTAIVRKDAQFELAEQSKADLAKAIASARGGSEPPQTKVGFGE